MNKSNLSKFIEKYNSLKSKSESDAYSEEKKEALLEVKKKSTSDGGNEEDEGYSSDSKKDNKKEMKENAPSTSCVEFFSCLLHCGIQVRIYHWQSDSYAQHSALGDLYDSLSVLTDSLVETMQGKDDKIFKGYKLESELNEDNKPLEYLKMMASWIKEERYKCFSKECTEIQNIIDEIISTIEKTNYKLKFLK